MLAASTGGGSWPGVAMRCIAGNSWNGPRKQCMVAAEFADSGVLPLQTPFAAAGFLFYAGHILREVPFDPHLPYLFDGEEILYSARLWTHG
jgi:Glycosyltransferase (GlcNAc)